MAQIHAPEYYRRKVKWRTAERDAYFREHSFVDVGILADNLGLSYRFVLSYMQKMGLRPIANNPPAKILWGTNRRKRYVA